MSAPPSLPASPVIRQISKHGVLVLHGFGIRVRVDCGRLCVEWGVGLERYNARLSRVDGHKLRRVILLGSDGYISLEALRFISDVGASFSMIDKRGKALMVCGPVAPSDSKLRRAQSLALGNGTALQISKELIRLKLEGQAALVRDMLHDSVASDDIVRFKADLSTAQSIEYVRYSEAMAAKVFWQSWAEIPICWPRKDERKVPEHWKRFGSRISPLTHSPRLAANPPNAILNFLYALLESESRIAAVAMGMLPDVGILHADTPSRDSLACDLMEVCRPKVDAFVLDWLLREPLRKADFWEDRNGNCRLVSALAIKLCETADTWRKLVAPVAEYVAQELWNSISRPASQQRFASRLTEAHRRSVKGSAVPEVNQPRPEHVCSDCGAKIRYNKKLCSKCSKRVTRMNFRAGRKAAQQPQYLAKRADTMRAHKEQIDSWQPSGLPGWLTRKFYTSRIVPALAKVPKVQITSALNVSWPYAKAIQSGHVPHARHWPTLARLAGVAG